MPTYDYRCQACAHEFDAFQSMTARPLSKCPECGERRLERLIGPGAGFIFRGDGFYITDYRSDSYKSAAEAETKPATETGSKPAADQNGKDAKPGTDAGAAAPTRKERAPNPTPARKPAAPRKRK
jgi:putative FmdB family regulatory protein